MSHDSNSNESLLVKELSLGSEQAFTELYNRHKDNVYGTALRITKSKIQAEEAVQEVFLKVWQNYEALGEITSFENYLYIIARNFIFDELKKTARDVSMEDAAMDYRYLFEDADSTLAFNEYNEKLAEILKELPPQQFRIFKMAKFEGLTHQKIGEELGISTPTVKKHMAQALKFIRKRISPYLNIAALVIKSLM